MPAPNEVFAGAYAIRDRLGIGGFATVFDADEISTGRRVALKILDPGVDGYDAATRARFARESRIVSRLSGPNTISMYASGESEDGLLYMAFEYVEGRDLAEVLARRGRLEEAAVVHIVRQVLEALDEAHGAGLLHRDIKPENIRLFERDGDPYRVKLLDFGLARPADVVSAVTKAGELVGTPRYMSPEQLTEQPLTPRSDLYSLGMVALEALVGREILRGNTWLEQYDRLLTGHVFVVPDPVVISPDVQRIVLKMAAQRPEDRFASAGAALDALDRVQLLASEEIPTVDDELAVSADEVLATTSVRTTERTVSTRTVGIAAGVAATIGVVAALVSGPPPPPPPRIEPPAHVVENPLAAPQAAPSPPPPAVADGGAAADFGPVATLDGCGAAAPFEGRGRIRERVVLGGDSWPAIIPTGYDPAHRHPVVFLFHQTAETGELMLRYTAFDALADRDRFVVISLDDSSALGQPWMSTTSHAPTVLRALGIADEQLCLDRRRVFLVGQGSGGRAVSSLACEPWVTAIATNSFRTFVGEELCEPIRPYIMLTGTKSAIDPIEGGTGKCGALPKRSLAEMEALVRRHASCADDPRVSLRHRESVCYEWDCEIPFQSCHLDGGQGWPGSPPRAAFTRCDLRQPRFPTAKTIWEFFRAQKPLPEPEGRD